MQDPSKTPFRRLILSRYTYVAILFVFFAVSLILEAQRTARSCKSTVKRGSSKIVQTCDTYSSALFCSGSAFDIKLTVVSEDDDGQIVTRKLDVLCPWSIRTSILNYASIIGAIVFSCFFIKANRQSSITIGFFVSGLTAVSVLFMAIDTKHGYDMTKLYIKAGDNPSIFHHGIFIANIFFSGVACLALLILTISIVKGRKFTSSATHGPTIMVQVSPSPVQTNYSPQPMYLPQGGDQSGRPNFSGQPIYSGQTPDNGQHNYNGQPIVMY